MMSIAEPEELPLSNWSLYVWAPGNMTIQMDCLQMQGRRNATATQNPALQRPNNAARFLSQLSSPDNASFRFNRTHNIYTHFEQIERGEDFGCQNTCIFVHILCEIMASGSENPIPKTAAFRTINYVSMIRGEQDALSHLLSACCEDGFFWLEISSVETKPLWPLVNEVYEVMEKFFQLPLEAKLQHDTAKVGDGING